MYELFTILTDFICVLPIDGDQLKKTIDFPVRDFEDMLQYQCAIAGQCDCLVTNNKRDFLPFSKLPLFTSGELLGNIFPK